jgi:predicted DNA-binding transcriptional regulator AlpA
MEKIFKDSNLLVNINEIASWAGISRATIYNIRKRNKHFPIKQQGLSGMRDTRFLAGEIFEFFTGEPRDI